MVPSIGETSVCRSPRRRLQARRPSFGCRLRTALASRRARLVLAAAAVAAVAAAALFVGPPGASGPRTVRRPRSSTGRSRRTPPLARGRRTGRWNSSISTWQKYHAYITRRFHAVRAADGSEHTTYSPVTAAGHLLMDMATEVYDATTGRSGPATPAQRSRGGSMERPSRATGRRDHPAHRLRRRSARRPRPALRLGETVLGGRPAWTVTCSKGELIGLPASGRRLAGVRRDGGQADWLPLRLEETGGQDHVQRSVPQRRVDEPLPEDASPGAAGRAGQRCDGGFHRVTLDEAVAAPGVIPLVPGFVPDGYQLSYVAVARPCGVLIGLAEVEERFSGRYVFALQY